MEIALRRRGFASGVGNGRPMSATLGGHFHNVMKSRREGPPPPPPPPPLPSGNAERPLSAERKEYCGTLSCGKKESPFVFRL